MKTTTAPAWIGWLEIDLHSLSTASDQQVADRGWPGEAASALATIDVSVRLDIVSFWIGSRTIAVADRDALTAWVRQPDAPLVVDDLEFVVINRQLCLRLDGGGPYVLSAAAASDLVRAL